MRSKDLTVGMEVAIKIGHNIYHGWVLQSRTTWVEQRYGGAPFRDSVRIESNKTAVAYEAKWAKYLQPEVVQNGAILSPWSDYLVQKEKEDALAVATWQADKDNHAKEVEAKAKHSVCVQQLADQIGVALQAGESDKVVISFADLQYLTAKREE